MTLKQRIRSLARTFGYDIVPLERTPADAVPERYPPGHFYSVVPSLSELSRHAASIFARPAAVSAVNLNSAAQIRILREIAALMEDPPFYAKGRATRFDIDNDSFSYDDAPVLHAMLRRIRPRRVVEIGSGHSSACMLDTDERHLGASVQFTFIDVDCSVLRRLLREEDLARVRVIEQPVQDVDRAVFATLSENDLLFVDSSHVVKIGSDLTTIMFEILPSLAPGVWIHFHDVRYPFQYPRDLVSGGSFWNEAYLLRAFLMYNRDFEIAFWLNHLVGLPDPEVGELLRRLPLDKWDARFNRSRGDISGAGGSLYLRKR